MNELLDALIAQLPDAIGGVLCDGDGEAIATARGKGALPPGGEEEARRHLPRAMASTVSVDVLALRLAAAEPVAALRALEISAKARGAGAVGGYEVRHPEMHVLVSALVDDVYLVLFVRHTARVAYARACLDRAKSPLIALLQ